ncbi:MAG TPA: LuxR C-terminal-related transcriptional regulator [Arenibaculum sp.]|nr:LuxR C-terminal-related transcriptional regulator [Arenibaculum sp.]
MTVHSQYWTFPTKLVPPETESPLVKRCRLTGLADRLDGLRLAIVTGPAGMGKTTVLAQWHAAAASRGSLVAWLSLDATDAQPRRFLTDLSHALAEVAPGFSRTVAELLPNDPDLRLGTLLPSLIDELLDRRCRLGLFLDDYHEVTDEGVQADMAMLVRHLPAGACVVIGSRNDPPLPLTRPGSRMAGGRDVLHVRWQDLRFTVEETRKYLRLASPVALSDEHVRIMAERTEGWVAGLQLAALSLDGGTEAGALVAGFSGNRADVADYLLEEVLQRQPEEIRRFLLNCSILERMTAPLCDALTQGNHAQRILEELERKNLFLFRLDEHRVWFRFHHLFQEFLVQRLEAENPAMSAALHLRASLWFESHGLPLEAVRHALAAGAFGRAADLLSLEGRVLFRMSEFKELRRWIEKLPQAVVQGHPDLSVLHAWALAYLGEFGAARRAIAAAGAALDGKPESACARVRAELRILRACLGVIQNDNPGAEKLDERVVEVFPEDTVVRRAFAKVMLGYDARAAGCLDEAIVQCREAADISDSGSTSLVHMLARFNWATVTYLAGRIAEAQDLVRQGLRVAAERRWHNTIGYAFMRVLQAVILLDHLRADDAAAELDVAVKVLEATQAYGFLGVAFVEQGKAFEMLGLPGRRNEALARARAVAERYDVARVRFRADLAELRMAVTAGDLEAAHRFAERAEQTIRNPVGSWGEQGDALAIERLRLLLAQRRHTDLVREAAAALRSATSAGRLRYVVEILDLQAGGWQALGVGDKALAKLHQALALAGSDAVPRCFLLPGAPLGPLLDEIDPAGPAGVAAKRLRASLAPGAPARPSAVRPVLEEDLHHRELQILRLVSQGLRNRQIAQSLFVSEETIKWYLKRLFTKLDVTSRTHAVARARALGIIA